MAAAISGGRRRRASARCCVRTWPRRSAHSTNGVMERSVASRRSRVGCGARSMLRAHRPSAISTSNASRAGPPQATASPPGSAGPSRSPSAAFGVACSNAARRAPHPCLDHGPRTRQERLSGRGQGRAADAIDEAGADLLLEPLDAREAEELGVFDECVPADELMTRALARAQRYATRPPRLSAAQRDPGCFAGAPSQRIVVPSGG